MLVNGLQSEKFVSMVRALYAQGLSRNKISKTLHAGHDRVQSVIRELKKDPEIYQKHRQNVRKKAKKGEVVVVVEPSAPPVPPQPPGKRGWEITVYGFLLTDDFHDEYTEVEMSFCLDKAVDENDVEMALYEAAYALGYSRVVKRANGTIGIREVFWNQTLDGHFVCLNCQCKEFVHVDKDIRDVLVDQFFNAFEVMERKKDRHGGLHGYQWRKHKQVRLVNGERQEFSDAYFYT